MIPCKKVAKPDDFDTQALTPGTAWVLANPKAERPKDLWSAFKPALADGFQNLCAYSAMYDPVGTVDHFVSWDEDREKAYDWSNYRFASGWINSSKQGLASSLMLDPFKVKKDWFEILLPSLELEVSDAMPKSRQKGARWLLKRLHLDHDERVLRQRREWYRMYQDGELTLDGLRKKAPLIWAAVVKKGVVKKGGSR